MRWREAASRPDPAALRLLGVFVVGLLVAGCTSGPGPTGASSVTPRESALAAVPSAATPPITASPAPSQVTPSRMELVSTFTGAPDLFSKPDGIGLDQEGNLYVADAGNSRIQKLDGKGHLLRKWGSQGSKDGQFNCVVCGLAVDGQGNVYVTDSGNHRVQKFDGNGKFLSKWGSQGTGDGQFVSPFGIAVDRDGNVYVGDPIRSRVQKFDGKGKFLATWGSRGNGAGQFSEDLADIATDALGNIYVTDRTNGLQVFDNDMQFVAKWDDCGDDRLVVSATGIALDTQGNIYVNDGLNGRICKYDGSGAFLTALSGFTGPVGLIAVDKQGDIYGSEPFDDVVLRFHQP
jgi:tripartite motif-containing protein 71